MGAQDAEAFFKGFIPQDEGTDVLLFVDEEDFVPRFDGGELLGVDEAVFFQLLHRVGAGEALGLAVGEELLIAFREVEDRLMVLIFFPDVFAIHKCPSFRFEG